MTRHSKLSHLSEKYAIAIIAYSVIRHLSFQSTIFMSLFTASIHLVLGLSFSEWCHIRVVSRRHVPVASSNTCKPLHRLSITLLNIFTTPTALIFDLIFPCYSTDPSQNQHLIYFQSFLLLLGCNPCSECSKLYAFSSSSDCAAAISSRKPAPSVTNTAPRPSIRCHSSQTLTPNWH